tara:strand:- start:696 stop:1940 length:1245 start_codon:yes stop_codon:yes gene_type:complete
MANIKENKKNLDDEIDLVVVFNNIINFSKALIKAKTIIFLSILFSISIALIYINLHKQEYIAVGVVELGTFNDISNNQAQKRPMFIQYGEDRPIKTLLKALKIQFIYKQQFQKEKLRLEMIEDKLIRVSYKSLKKSEVASVMDSTLEFFEKNELDFLIFNINDLIDKIKLIDNEISFIKTSLSLENKSNITAFNNEIQKINNEVNFYLASEIEKLSNEVVLINIEIPSLENKIMSIDEIIEKDGKNLLLLKADDILLSRNSVSPTLEQVIFTYKDKRIEYETNLKENKQRRKLLVEHLKSIEENPSQSGEIFKLEARKKSLTSDLQQLIKFDILSEETFSEDIFELSQKRFKLESQLSAFNKLKTNSKKEFLEKYQIEPIKINKTFFILISIISGFMLSILIVFTKLFMREQNK